MVAQVAALLIAGFETSASILVFGLYELVFHPDIQARLRTEIQETLNRNNQQITYEAVQEMKYLDMVVSGKSIN